MKIIKKLVEAIILPGILCCLLFPLTGYGGSLTTDNLNVNKDAAVYGRIILPGSSGSLYSNGMALSYSFSTNSSTQLDASGNNNTGTVYSAIWTNGRLGSAYYYDGTNDYISVPSSSSLNLSTGMTVMAWVICYTNADSSGWDGIVCKGNASDRNYELGRVGGSYACFDYMYGGIGRSHLQGTKNICDGAWHLLAATWNGSRFYLYVDGVEDEIDYANSYGLDWSTPLVTNNLPLLIGKISDGYSFSYFNGGIIDEVRIHNYALSSQEVFNAYVSGGLVIENGSLSIAGNATVSGSVQADAFTGNGGGLTNLTANNSTALGGVVSAEYVKRDGSVAMTGNVKLNGKYLSYDGDNEGVCVATNGFVGIGTASPVAVFDVAVATDTGTAPLLKVYQSAGTPVDNDFISWGSWWGPLSGGIRAGGMWAWDTQIYSDYGLSFRGGAYNGSSPHVAILPNGNVGIGTVTPSAKLEVNGSAIIQSNLTVNGLIQINPSGNLGMGVYTNQ